MSLYGAPRTPRSCLDRGTRSEINATDLDAMRAAAWHQHGVAAISIADITDPWLRQALANEATRRWGRGLPKVPAGKAGWNGKTRARNGGQHHGR